MISTQYSDNKHAIVRLTARRGTVSNEMIGRFRVFIAVSGQKIHLCTGFLYTNVKDKTMLENECQSLLKERENPCQPGFTESICLQNIVLQTDIIFQPSDPRHKTDCPRLYQSDRCRKMY